MKLLIFFVVFGLSSAAYMSDKPCAIRPFMSSIDVDKFSGKWYTLKAYPSFHALSMDCLNMNVASTGPYSYDITGCLKQNGQMHCGVSHINHPSEDGKYVLKNERYTSHGSFLYMDYDNYHISYECKNMEDGKSMDNLFIVSRKPTLSGELLKEALEKVKEYFNTDHLKTVIQDDAFCGRNM